MAKQQRLSVQAKNSHDSGRQEVLLLAVVNEIEQAAV